MITLFASTTPPQIRATITTSQEQLRRLLNALADFDTGSMRLVVEVVGEREDPGNPVSESFPSARPVNSGNAPSSRQREKMAGVPILFGTIFAPRFFRKNLSYSCVLPLRSA
jgi:hypothetical protein